MWLVIVLYNLTEQGGFTGFLFARLQGGADGRRAHLRHVRHVPGRCMLTVSWSLEPLVRFENS